MKRGGPIKRTTPLRSRAPRWRARRTEAMSPWCEAHTCVCTGRAQHRHHRLMRSQGGGDEASNTIDVCRACHQWIHANPAASYDLGLLIRRGQVA